MRTALLGSVLFTVASAVCHRGTYLMARAEIADPTFGYDGLTGPLNWHGLSANNSACALGKNQSPINVATATARTVAGSDLEFRIDAYPAGAALENLGTTLEVIANGSLTVAGVGYELKQFHFHTPSEHRIDGEHYSMEVHFVFQSASNQSQSLAVVGIPIEIGDASQTSPVLQAVFQNLAAASQTGNTTETGALDFSSVQQLVGSSDVYQYSGSLTTPPCAEGVAWNVARQPLFVDYQLFRRVKAVLGFNSRYSQGAAGAANLLDHARAELDASE